MNIGLLGHGVVGKGVTTILEGQDGLNVVSILVKDESEIMDERFTLQFEEFINNPSIDIVVECMGGIEPAHSFVKEALEKKKHVVTSNKKMLATHEKELFSLAKENNVSLLFEATVGGGIPWMANLRKIKAQEPIQKIEGIFNGTSNYILSNMFEKGTSFEEELKQAQELGYAEQDPSDDIDGWDTRYKVCLSIYEAFDAYVDVQDIPTLGIRSIKKEDLDYAKENGYTIKLIGQAEALKEGISATVLPTFVKRESLLGSVSANFNLICCESPYLGEAAFYAQGAGSHPTGHAVVDDILTIKEGKDKEDIEKRDAKIINNKESIYYIRCNSIEKLERITNKKIDENTILTKPISIQEVLEFVGENVFVAEVR